jgi:hypothetical protein
MRAVAPSVEAASDVAPVKSLFAYYLYPLVIVNAVPPAAVFEYVAACVSKLNLAVKVIPFGSAQPEPVAASLSISVEVAHISAQSI